MLAATSSACDRLHVEPQSNTFAEEIMRKDRPGSNGTPKTVPNLLQRVGNTTLGIASSRDAPSSHRTENQFDFVWHDAEPLKKATKQQIKDGIRVLYDEKKNEGKKTPNINETKNEVFNWLAERNLEATKNRIGEIAEEPEFKKRRGPVGVRRNNKGMSRPGRRSK